MKIFYTDTFSLPLPANHRFPGEKYALLRQRILTAGTFDPNDLHIPQAATLEQIHRVHDPLYIQKLENGGLTDKEVRRLGLPWSPELVERAKRSSGATIQAAVSALQSGIAVNLGGGTHHAFSDFAQGYCVLNDSVIAARELQHRGLAERILVIDCDVHQGNGTAVVTAWDPTIFTFSIHGKNNFPYKKEIGDLDIELPDDTGDDAYLATLEEGLSDSFSRMDADLATYLAGADAHITDRYGRLALSKSGLARRDRVVLQKCFDAGLPVAVTMAGGYGKRTRDTVDIHFRTVEIAAEFSALWAES